MALVVTVPPPVPPTQREFVAPSLVGVPFRGFKLSLPTFSIGFIVTPALPGPLIGGQQLRDFPPTPSEPEPWVLGCIQNVIRQKITITWVDNNGAEASETGTFGQMLDGDQNVSGYMQHLPFVRGSNGPGVPPGLIGLLYGLRDTPTGVPSVWPPGPGPAWDIVTGGSGPFAVVATDTPNIFVFAFKGGGVSGSGNPIIEVIRSLTAQVWLTAARLSEIRDVSKHNVLAYTDEFTLEGKFDRRPTGGNEPSSASWFHFNASDFTRDAITVSTNPGNTKPPPCRPVVSGHLAVEAVKSFLKAKGFAP